MVINTDKYYFMRTENPCVGGSIPPLATNKNKRLESKILSAFLFNKECHRDKSTLNKKPATGTG